MKLAVIGLASISLFVAHDSGSAQPSTDVPIEHRQQGGSTALPVGPTNPDWMAAHFVNVGQGSGAIFEFSCGLIIVDTGGQGEGPTNFPTHFANYLDGIFARRPDLNRTIDFIYITHPHPDHTLGIDTLIAGDRFRIGHVVTSAITTGGGRYDQRDLIRFANLRRIPAVPIKTSLITSQLGLTSRYLDPLRCRGTDPDIRVLWGHYDQPHRWPRGEEEDENNHSVAVRIAFGESSYLVVGDMEEISQDAMVARYQRNIGVLNTDVYVAGHHGSGNGTSEALVRAMKPEMAVISAGDPSDREPGRFNAYKFGHPNEKAIERISDTTYGVTMTRPAVRVGVGIKGENPFTNTPPQFEVREINKAIFSTGWDGDVVVIANADGLKRVIIQ